MKFSANLGFLWTELTLPDAIEAAASTGFDAVEAIGLTTRPPRTRRPPCAGPASGCLA